ncbi:MAG: hypothetical protein E7001_04260 [Coriobacteriaceae bacterium]|nr:hypothetical protein [Coriobacteriaceae bacterium]
MKAVRKVIRAMILFAVLVAVAVVLANTALRDTPFGEFVRGAGSSAKIAAVNAAIDASGIKEQLDADLRGRSADIAQATGLPESQVNHAIDELDIPSWSARDLPRDAVESGSFETTYQGVAATVTTYRDPGYLSISAGGQQVAFDIPESAQMYVGFLNLM